MGALFGGNMGVKSTGPAPSGQQMQMGGRGGWASGPPAQYTPPQTGQQMWGGSPPTLPTGSQAPAGQQMQPFGQGIGSISTGITAGALPQGRLDQASNTMLAPQSSGLHGALGDQFNHLMSQQQNAGNVNMLRDAAPQQAGLQLGQQMGNANAGLQNAGLLSRLQQDQFASGAGGRSLLAQMLGGMFGGGF